MIEDTLREALQADAVDLIPVGPGPDHARQRAFRRKRRMQSGAVALTAAVLVGGTLAVVNTRSSGSTARVQSQPPATTPELSWRAVNGTVLDDYRQFTSPDGVTYALSTAPGSTSADTVRPQELYTTRDGVSWTHESLGATPWVADLAAGQGGVLYAIGTGPGTQAGTTAYQLKTSSNGGAQWDVASIPVDLTPPSATVPLDPSTTVHIARGAHSTVVVAQARYSLHLSLSQESTFRTTASGVQILDMAGCKAKVAQPDPSARGCEPTVTATHPWSDYGISDPSALQKTEVLVRNDGGDWQKVAGPNGVDTTVSDLTATSNGFILGAQRQPAGDGVPVSVMWSSADGRTWSPLAGPAPALVSVESSGDRIVATDAASNIFVSNDAGATWSAGQSASDLLQGATVEQYGLDVSAGALGYAAVARVGNENAKFYMLHSADGATWKVTDLAGKGAPANGFVSGVTVGTDHIAVDYQYPVTRPNGAQGFDLKTLIATPQA